MPTLGFRHWQGALATCVATFCHGVGICAIPCDHVVPSSRTSVVALQGDQTARPCNDSTLAVNDALVAVACCVPGICAIRPGAFLDMNVADSFWGFVLQLCLQLSLSRASVAASWVFGQGLRRLSRPGGLPTMTSSRLQWLFLR